MSVVRKPRAGTSESARRIASVVLFFLLGGKVARLANCTRPSNSHRARSFPHRRHRKDDIGAMRAGTAMRALIDHEGTAEPARIDFIRAQQIDKIDFAFSAPSNARDIAPPAAGRKPRSRAPTRAAAVWSTLKRSSAFGRRPCGSDHAACQGDARRKIERIAAPSPRAKAPGRGSASGASPPSILARSACVPARFR